MKYIILEDFKMPIIFHELLNHSDMARGRNVRSAGFCDVNGQEELVSCWGRSASLNISSKQDDGDILTHFLFPVM